MKASVSIEEVLDRRLRDPAEASLYLNTVLADGDPAALKIAIRDVIRTRGGVAEVARSAAMKREAVSRALSVRGNPPRLDTLMRILAAARLRLQVADANTNNAG